MTAPDRGRVDLKLSSILVNASRSLRKLTSRTSNNLYGQHQPLTIYLHPAGVMRWSRKHQCWTRYVITVKALETDEPTKGLIDAEKLFLQELELNTGVVHDLVWHEALS